MLDNRDGARSVILGGLLYIVQDADAEVPAFRQFRREPACSVVRGRILPRPASHYTIYLQDSAARDEVRAASFPARGYGRIVPWLTAGH